MDSPTKIPNGCEAVAKKISKDIGGKFLEITPKLGRWKGVETGWFHHVSVVKNGKVFYKLTGKQGMKLDDYIKNFDDAEFLDFKIKDKSQFIKE